MRYFFLTTMFSLTILSSANAANVRWTAVAPNSDMNDPGNWIPNIIPGSSDTAVFDSNIPGISTHPNDSVSPFSCSNFNFPNNASIFNISFNNQPLIFNGLGITGANTNTNITSTNSNNSSFPGDLISFQGATNTSGSAFLTSSNSGSLSGNLVGTAISGIGANLYSSGDFTISSGASIDAHNIGVDSTMGSGNNGTANTGKAQVLFDQTFQAVDNVNISITNNGTFSGANTTQGDAVAIVNGGQFKTSGAFQVGNNFSCNLANTGNDASQGAGLNNIGQLNQAQMMLQTSGTAVNNCKINISNTGINSSNTSNFPDFVGYINDAQFFAGNSFQAGSNFEITTINSGSDNSQGNGSHQVAMINSNSGTTGNQILFQQGLNVQDYAKLSAINTGTYTGTNTNGGSNVAGMNLHQIAIGDQTAIGSYYFNALGHINLSASNSGTDMSQGIGGNAVGNVSADQIILFTPTTLGDFATITLSNRSNFTGEASTRYVNVGSIGGSQLNSTSTFSAGDFFILNAENSGTNSGSGIGGYFIGDVIQGQQVAFQHDATLGNNAMITISNSGSDFSNTTNQNQTGSLMGYGKQLLAKNNFQTGDDFKLTIENLSFGASSGPEANLVGFINNNVADNTASQFHIGGNGTFGKRTSINLSNEATYEGSNSTGNLIGVLSGQQFCCLNTFNAGNNFNLTVSNTGINNGSGQNDNSIATVSSAQVEFAGATTLGNNSSLLITNSGTNLDMTGTLNDIGTVATSQLLVEGDFLGGENLNIRTNNIMVNQGDADNIVACVSTFQVFFNESCTLNDGSTISAYNSGNVGISQILFSEGLNIASGKVKIEAENHGTVGDHGIDIQGNTTGGNVAINLINSSLNINSELPTFTIGELSGDQTSLVQSRPQLIINTDALTHAEFFGTVQNYPEGTSSVLKLGFGIQKLSGLNTYTGLTTVQEGTMIVNGTILGDLLINNLGTLKGNGQVNGTVRNHGTVSPGESIGLLTFGNFVNDSGTYAVEVTNQASDQIIVLGTAEINGGVVTVSSFDGTFRFQQPYTILSAVEGVTGQFSNVTSSALINPLLSYDPNNIYLTLQSALINAAENCNEIGVATNLDSIINPNASESRVISALVNLPLDQAREALVSLSGYQYAEELLITEITTRRFLRRLYDPIRDIITPSHCCHVCQDACGITGWLETGDGFTNFQKNNRLPGFSMNSFEVTGGMQKSFCYNLELGVAASYEYDHVKYKSHGGKSNRNSEYLALYGVYRPCQFYVLTDLVYGHTKSRISRSIHIGNFRDKITSTPNTSLFAFYGEAGIDFNVGCFLLQPFLGIQAGKNWRSRSSECDQNGIALSIDKKNWSRTSSRLGLHMAASNFCNCVDVNFDLAWNKLLSTQKNRAEAKFRNFGNTYSICGSSLNDSIDYALTLTTCLCDSLRTFLEIGGESWKHANTFDIVAGIEYNW